MGIPVMVKGDNGKMKMTVVETHISQYKKKFPILNDYLDYKGLKKYTTTYGDKFLKHINEVTGRVHSSFLQLVKTGRISSSNPNMQNIPHPDEFRACFTPEPKEGTKFIVADYSGQELRILADRSSEPAMLDRYNNGDGDLHSLTASLMYGKEVNNQGKNTHLRKFGKDTNFLMSYGGGPSALARRSGISFPKAASLIRKYFKEFSHLKALFDKEFYLTKERGFVVIDPITNRRTWHPYHSLWSECLAFKEKWESRGWIVPKAIDSAISMSEAKMKRDSQNFPIQGTGASMTKLACIMLYKKQLKENSFNKFKIILCVHDEIVIECKSEYAEEVAEQLRECMLRSGKVFVKQVEMEVGVKITDFWTH